MKDYPFSPLLKNSSCPGWTPGKDKTKYETVREAAKACYEDSKCTAYDWQGCDIDSDSDSETFGSWTVLKDKEGNPIPKTTFYTEAVLSDAPCAPVTDNVDAAKVYKKPLVIVAPDEPENPTEGELWVNALTTKTQMWLDGEWVTKKECLVEDEEGNCLWKEDVNNVSLKDTPGKPGPTAEDGYAYKEGDIVLNFVDPETAMLTLWSLKPEPVTVTTDSGDGATTTAELSWQDKELYLPNVVPKSTTCSRKRWKGTEQH